MQFYIKDVIGSVVRPMKELKGFQKVALQPGESTLVQFDITPDMLEFITIDMARKADPGDFIAMVGGSSASLQSVEFKLE